MSEKVYLKKRGAIDLIFSRYGILVVLLGIIVIAAIISPEFLSANNIINIFKQIAATGMLALGMTFVIISGGVDLSVGTILSICGVITVNLLPVLGVPLAIVVGILCGVGIGLLNGWLVTLTGGTMGSAFIITFGMSTVIESTALTIVNGAITSSSAFPSFTMIGQGSWGFIPISVVLFFIAIIMAQFILKKTMFGRINYCLGINDEATYLSGINVRKFRTLVYMLSGMFASFGAILLCSRVCSASPVQGSGYELDAIAAVVLGGTRMGGGAGSIMKSFVGILLFGVLTNALNVIGVSSYEQMIVKGIIIMVAVLMDKRSIKVENEMLARSV